MMKTVSENHFGFMPHRSTMKVIYLLRRLFEKYRERGGSSHGFHRIRKKHLIRCLVTLYGGSWREGVTRRYIEVVKDMYKGSAFTIKSPVCETMEFPITVGLHQGSFLKSYVFSLVMDELTIHIQVISHDVQCLRMMIS